MSTSSPRTSASSSVSRPSSSSTRGSVTLTASLRPSAYSAIRWPRAARPRRSDDVGRQDRANRSGVHESNSLVGSDLLGLQQSTPDHRLIDGVRQLGFHANLAHAGAHYQSSLY